MFSAVLVPNQVRDPERDSGLSPDALVGEPTGSSALVEQIFSAVVAQLVEQLHGKE